MNNYRLGSGSTKSFYAYQKSEFDLESGAAKRARKPRNSPLHPIKTIQSFGNRLHCYFKLHPLVVSLISLCLGVMVLAILSLSESRYRIVNNYGKVDMDSGNYPFPNLHNLVRVAGHSVIQAVAAGRLTKRILGYWSLTRSIVVKLLLFGGETRKDAGPRSEAQSYWAVAESKGWFGKQDSVKWRALTEEHARDSFENLLISVCRFRELTGAYPQNITVVSYDFKEERFVHLHRSAIGFPESRFFYTGTPASITSKEAALKGEALVRTQSQEDPYGCQGSLYHIKAQTFSLVNSLS
ncbi:Transmembrane protein [Quillaja saponaria]|uniref:Transmembrane protein n=1 Tax=Quillaja saponaria TaxID=32244 RepID=A0AAD7LWB4_QUISA|nr:Transmembrane protein [Quillaja saponaria]